MHRALPLLRCQQTLPTVCDRLQPCIPGLSFMLLPAPWGSSWIHIPALIPPNPVAIEPQTSHLSDGVIAWYPLQKDGEISKYLCGNKRTSNKYFQMTTAATKDNDVHQTPQSQRHLSPQFPGSAGTQSGCSGSLAGLRTSSEVYLPTPSLWLEQAEELGSALRGS